MNRLIYSFEKPSNAARFISHVNSTDFEDAKQLRAKLAHDTCSVMVNYEFRPKSSKLGEFDRTPAELDSLAEQLGGKEID